MYADIRKKFDSHLDHLNDFLDEIAKAPEEILDEEEFVVEKNRLLQEKPNEELGKINDQAFERLTRRLARSFGRAKTVLENDITKERAKELADIIQRGKTYDGGKRKRPEWLGNSLPLW